METEFQDYAEGGLNTFLRKFPTRTKQTNLILKHGIVDRLLWDWYDSLVQGTVKRRTISVVVLDPAGDQPVMEWQFREVLPCKWQGPDLNATQNNVAVETLELCHQGFERRR